MGLAGGEDSEIDRRGAEAQSTTQRENEQL